MQRRYKLFASKASPLACAEKCILLTVFRFRDSDFAEIRSQSRIVCCVTDGLAVPSAEFHLLTRAPCRPIGSSKEAVICGSYLALSTLLSYSPAGTT